MIKIDKNLVKIINVFNSKGVNTFFSCEGHLDRDLFRTYIIFDSVSYRENKNEDELIIKIKNYIEKYSLDLKVGSISAESFMVYKNISTEEEKASALKSLRQLSLLTF